MFYGVVYILRLVPFLENQRATSLFKLGMILLIQEFELFILLLNFSLLLVLNEPLVIFVDNLVFGLDLLLF